MESESGELIVKVGSNTILMQDILVSNSQYDKITIKDSSGNVKVYNDWKIRRGNVPSHDENSADNVTLSGGSGNNTISSYGDNVTISGGKGKDRISNGGDRSKIFGDAGNDSIGNYGGNYVSIFGGKGSDSIGNSGDCALIFGDDNNDFISNNSGNYVSIFGGKGNDTISSKYSKDTISGGAGNDLFFNQMIGESLIQYASGDGKDTIYGFNDDDTLQITKGTYTTSTKGNDVIVKVGAGSITLKNGKSTKITIIDSSGKAKTKTYGASSFALFAEDNFATADNLSEIVKNDSTATSLEKISENNFENFTQENNLLTFAEK